MKKNISTAKQNARHGANAARQAHGGPERLYGYHGPVSDETIEALADLFEALWRQRKKRRQAA